MGEIRAKEPVLLIVPAFAPQEPILDWGKEQLRQRYGSIVLESELFRFDLFTNYYASSMGEVLYKRIFAFAEPISPCTLAEIKVETNKIEEHAHKEFTQPNTVERPLNLDPGYVDLGKLILASTKDHAHRIYLREGIFAELTLIYTKKRWQSLPWTYPDYQSTEYQAFFDRCREYLKSRREFDAIKTELVKSLF